MLGQTGEWRTALEEASRLEPGNAALLLRIARSYRQDGKFAEARAALERALLADGSREAEMELVRLHFESGDGEAAVRRLQSLVRRGKLNVTDAELAALDLARFAGLEPAARFLRSVADLPPGRFSAAVSGGRVFLRKRGCWRRRRRCSSACCGYRWAIGRSTGRFTRIVRRKRSGCWSGGIAAGKRGVTGKIWARAGSTTCGFRRPTGCNRSNCSCQLFSPSRGNWSCRIIREISRVFAIEHLGKILMRLEGDGRDRAKRRSRRRGSAHFSANFCAPLTLGLMTWRKPFDSAWRSRRWLRFG